MKCNNGKNLGTLPNSFYTRFDNGSTPSVVHTEEEETIRIISARRAERLERRKYEEGDS